METTTKTIDIDKPMRLVGKDESALYVLDVLFHNDQVVLINTGGSMLKRYRKEHAKFVSETYDPRYQEMFDHLDKLLVQ